MHGLGQFTAEEIEKARRYAAATPPADLDPRVGALVNELIGRVAEEWTMLVLEVLGEHGELRFTRLSDLVSGISQKMLTQTCEAAREGADLAVFHDEDGFASFLAAAGSGLKHETHTEEAFRSAVDRLARVSARAAGRT